jgi:hypothetical protein
MRCVALCPKHKATTRHGTARQALREKRPDARLDWRGAWHAYLRWNPTFESMRVAPMGRSIALEDLAQKVTSVTPPGRQAQSRAELRSICSDVLPSGTTVSLYFAHWDNQDDTNFDGVIAVDLAKGEISVVMTNDFA